MNGYRNGRGSNQYQVRSPTLVLSGRDGYEQVAAAVTDGSRPDTMRASEVVARFVPVDGLTWTDLRTQRCHTTHYAALTRSVAEHGIRNPVWVSSDGKVLDGHSRVLVAEDLGLDVSLRWDPDLAKGVPRPWQECGAVDARGLTEWHPVRDEDVPITESDIEFDCGPGCRWHSNSDDDLDIEDVAWVFTEEGARWSSMGVSRTEAEQWQTEIDGGFPEDEVPWWVDAGIGPGEAPGWRSWGYPPEESVDWRDSGFGPSDASDWRRNNFGFLEAARWRDGLFTSSEAARWRVYGFGVESAQQWRDAGWDAADVARFAQSDLTTGELTQ